LISAFEKVVVYPHFFNFQPEWKALTRVKQRSMVKTQRTNMNRKAPMAVLDIDQSDRRAGAKKIPGD
jgi:hypothetical protein